MQKKLQVYIQYTLQEEIKDDIPAVLQFTHDLECYKNCLEIK